jgi:hypothetical protein
MNEEHREAWRKALAAKAAAGRRQRYRPRKTLLNVRGAGMVRIPPSCCHRAALPNRAVLRSSGAAVRAGAGPVTPADS